MKIFSQKSGLTKRLFSKMALCKEYLHRTKSRRFFPKDSNIMSKNTSLADISRASLDRSDQIVYKNPAIAGLSEVVVRQISEAHNEPNWMLELRLKSLEVFHEKNMPTWGPSLANLDLESIYYFAKPE
jgi:hypothetical protein